MIGQHTSDFLQTNNGMRQVTKNKQSKPSFPKYITRFQSRILQRTCINIYGNITPNDIIKFANRMQQQYKGIEHTINKNFKVMQLDFSTNQDHLVLHGRIRDIYSFLTSKSAYNMLHSLWLDFFNDEASTMTEDQ